MNAKQQIFVSRVEETLAHCSISTWMTNEGTEVTISTGDVVATVTIDTGGQVTRSLIRGKNCAILAAMIYPNLLIAERLAMGLLQFPTKGNG